MRATSDAPAIGAPLGDLVDHLLERYHAPLKQALPRVQALAERAAVEAEADQPRNTAVLTAVVRLRNSLEPHLRVEEDDLFPWIREGCVGTRENTGTVMRIEHDDVVMQLAHLSGLTGDYVVPVKSSATVVALWAELKSLDDELREHIAFETDLLFPRALGLRMRSLLQTPRQ